LSADLTQMKLMLFGDAAKQFEQPILERHPDIEMIAVSPRDVMNVDCSDVRAAVGWRFIPGMFRAMPNLKWIQSISVGVDDWVYDPSISPEVVVTNTKGLYADEVAEYVIWALITLSRRFDVAVKNQVKRHWQQIDGTRLSGKTIGIAGLGHVGRATARLAKSFGMQVVGICRDANAANVDDAVDETIAVTDLDSVLGRLDGLAICLPVTSDTHGLFSSDVIAKLKHGAIVINVARESLVDYSSLLEALRQGRLSGAALDVFEKEPLRKRSPLWKCPNLLVTPHVSALSNEYRGKVASLICNNLDRLYAGRPLECVVDRVKGY